MKAILVDNEGLQLGCPQLGLLAHPRDAAALHHAADSD